MGYPRYRFYRFNEVYDKGGELALQEIRRKMPRIRNRVEEHVEKAVTEFAIDKPTKGRFHTSYELKKERYVRFSMWRPVQ